MIFSCCVESAFNKFFKIVFIGGNLCYNIKQRSENIQKINYLFGEYQSFFPEEYMFKRISAFICLMVICMTAAFCVNAEGISPELSKEIVNLFPGQAFRLTLTDNQYDKIFTSSDTSVASVNSDGLIFAKNAGVTEITCRLSTAKELKCTVNVREGSSPSEVRLNTQLITLKNGEKAVLEAQILPTAGRGYKVFSSSDETVARVDENGNITAKKSGSAVITVESESTAVSASCFVRVLDENENSFTTDVTGVLYNAAGEKLANTQAGITGEGMDKQFTTNEDGQFRLTDVVKGEYILTVYSAGSSSEGLSSGVTISSENVKLSCILTDKALCVMYGSNINTAAQLREIKLSQTEISLDSGKHYDIIYNSVPGNISDKEVHFSSSDPTIAQVDSSGRITALDEGNAVITVGSDDGRVSEKLTVHVTRYGIGMFGVTILIMLTLVIVLIITVYIYLRDGKKTKKKTH